MTIKVFTKRLPGGEFVKTGLLYPEAIIEADEILIRPIETGFQFMAKTNSFTTEEHGVKDGYVMTDTQGYEIRNNAGVVIDRYVTAVTDLQRKKAK